MITLDEDAIRDLVGGEETEADKENATLKAKKRVQARLAQERKAARKAATTTEQRGDDDDDDLAAFAKGKKEK